MKESDQLVTSFIILFRSFCYVMMPFGLKNVRATYQCCMLKCFGNLIRKTVEAYVDDIVVKSKQADQLVADLEKTFKKLRADNIKLNPREVHFQGLEGYAAWVHRLQAWHRSQPEEDLSHHEDGSDPECKGGGTDYRVPHGTQPLHRLLKKTDLFAWTLKAQEALYKVKKLLMKALILVPPAEKEPLLLYIAATTQVVSAALVVQREEARHILKVQHTVYFISEVLSYSKTRYP
jgi:hypothetical protein